MNCTDRDIYQWLRGVVAAAAAMPEIALLPGERMALSGHLFQEAESFVRAVAAALGDQPQLFADIPVDPLALTGRQDRAQALLKLQAALELYARRAADWYLLEQAAAVREAMSAVQQVRADGARPFPHPEHQRRADELAAAERILSERHARRRRPRAPAAPGATQRRAAADYARALRERQADRLEAAMGPPAAPASAAPGAPTVPPVHAAEAKPKIPEKRSGWAWTSAALRAIFHKLTPERVGLPGSAEVRPPQPR